jgi:hypothetical protein
MNSTWPRWGRRLTLAQWARNLALPGGKPGRDRDGAPFARPPGLPHARECPARPRCCRPIITWFSAHRIGDFAEWLSPNWRVEVAQDIATRRGHHAHASRPRAPQPHSRRHAIARKIRLAVGGYRHQFRLAVGPDAVSARSDDGALAPRPGGTGVFLLVFFYVLVRLYQLRRTD